MFDANFIMNPYPTYQHLLASGRIHWVDMLGGGWLVPHYDDVMTLLRDPRLSTSRAGIFTHQFAEEDREKLQEIDRIMADWLVFLDGQDHLRLRRMLGKAFTPRVIENLRPGIQRMTHELLDAVQEQGTIEFMSQFAHPLPALVIAQLLGVPRADRSRFVAWSDDLAAFVSSMQPTLEQAYRAQESLVAMRDYFRPLVAERREHPGDDFISLLINVEEQGAMLTEDQLLAQCTLFLFAGHETTRNLIGNGMLALLQHPDQQALLEEDPALIRGAIDEMVRYDPPVQLVPRIVAEDFELYGQQLKQGQMVELLLAAANRDAAQFPDPDRFDITRRNSRPASFGFGAHICIGMQLAYLEVEIAITTALQRLPHLRLATEAPVWSPNFGLRGLRSLRLAFDTEPVALFQELQLAA